VKGKVAAKCSLAVRVPRNWFEDEHAYIIEKKLGPVG
jgi:hypothetical protein